MEPFYAELGGRISLARIVRCLSQEELGRRLEPKVTRACIANIEAAKQRVLSHTLVQIAHALGVELWELVPARPRIESERRKNGGSDRSSGR